MKNKKVRVRFAPSPTGEIHLGSARTALFNYLFAKHYQGKIILRIEDTDVKRFVPGATERLIEALTWLGIEFDESPLKGEKFGPYIQSQRLGIYQEYAQKLIEDGQAYYCFCSEKRLKKMRQEQERKKQAPRYDRKCLTLSVTEKQRNIETKKPYVIRLKVPYGGLTEFDDLIRGHISIDNSFIDDQILIKSNGMPTYHLANVVDDHLMEISHVLRAEEWLPSTSKHIILYKAFNWEPPLFGHIPLVLAPDHSKLSKRHGAVSIEEFRQLGYLPEALINYIALLGWNPKTNREFFTLEELIKEFDISKINKAGAIFDLKKLNHFNHYYLQKIPISELSKMILNQIAKTKNKKDIFKIKKDKKLLDKIITVIRDRMIKLSDFGELARMFFEEPKYKPELLVFKKSTKESTQKGLKLIIDNLLLITSSQWGEIKELNKILQETVKAGGLSNGDVFWPVRLALSGLEKSPSPAELLWVLGKNESLKRLNKARKSYEHNQTLS